MWPLGGTLPVPWDLEGCLEGLSLGLASALHRHPQPLRQPAQDWVHARCQAALSGDIYQQGGGHPDMKSVPA